MSLRSKSKARQWALWLCAALVGLAAYVVVSRILYGSMSWNIVLPRNQRIVLPILALFWLFAWETRWDGVKARAKLKGEAKLESKAKGEGEERNGGGQRLTAIPAGESNKIKDIHSSPSPSSFGSSPIDDNVTGEELFNQARALPHLPIPDFIHDAEYLAILGRSAAKGYPPALTKFGEYAMRRAAWVEAYYWMKQAQWNGMHGLSPMLREIRKNWSRVGFPDQVSNINEHFTPEAGSIGRALLHIDSGHGAAKAKEFLKANYPEFLK